MLRVFESGSLRQSNELPQKGWAHLSAPREEELAQLKARVPENLVEHALDVDEVARVYHQKGATLIILRAPRNPKEDAELPYRAEVIGAILMNGLIITICQDETDVIDRLCAVDGFDESPNRFVLQLAMQVAERFLLYVRTIDKIVNELEAKLRVSLANQEVLELVKYQKSLVHFTTALGSNRIMLERLAKDPHLALNPEEQEMLEDTLVEVHQAIQMVGVSGDILAQMMDSFASIIANNLNVVMKALTALTLVLTGPMLVISIYGMNVPLPGHDNPYALAGILGGSFVLGAIVSTIFWRRGWL